MLLKRSTLVLLVLALVATSVAAQSLGQIIPIGGSNDPKAAEPGGETTKPDATNSPVVPSSEAPTSATSPATTLSPAPPTDTATQSPIAPPTTTSDHPVAPPTTTSQGGVAPPTQPPNRTTPNRQPGTATGTSNTGTGTGTGATGSPSPSNTPEKKSSGANLATAGIVVGSIVVAAAIGIWVFRKWKLSPSRDFQRKIGGDDYQDYPRSYESDTVFLRNLGDQPAEPAPTKSPYNANASLPSDDQYYDAGYANDSTAQGGAYGHGGHDGYGQQQAAYDHQGYDHSQGYDHGYDNTAYGAGQHDGYGGSQVGGGYGGSQVGGGYGGSQVGGYGAQDAGYAHSNVGGGYQHQGYDEYGHARR
ncbi:hypothetical protein BGZ97_004056 [Linnemannia gamsii]|uniref:Uncharacterized protein n=1 Tax=Linnemannia gamsii TaxID=64522 RepID=A0A9P6QU76_9FUNG|nr:hypothetical protein BGZ97_004056 [Linnemannia gamsii]